MDNKEKLYLAKVANSEPSFSDLLYSEIADPGMGDAADVLDRDRFAEDLDEGLWYNEGDDGYDPASDPRPRAREILTDPSTSGKAKLQALRELYYEYGQATQPYWNTDGARADAEKRKSEWSEKNPQAYNETHYCYYPEGQAHDSALPIS